MNKDNITKYNISVIGRGQEISVIPYKIREYKEFTTIDKYLYYR